MLATSTSDIVLSVVAAVLSVHTGAIVFLAVYLSRTREKVTRLEEWVRVYERKNGKSE